MANPPDIVAVEHIYGVNQTTKLSTTNATDVMTAVATNYTHKVNGIYISNIDGSADAECDIYIDKNGTYYYIIKTVVIPKDSTLSVLDQPLYLNYDAGNSVGDKLVAVASAVDDLDVCVSYEKITDVA